MFTTTNPTATGAANAVLDRRGTRATKSGFTPGDVTRSMLGYLALAGPFYVVVSLIQVFTRSGFSPLHNDWSLLARGNLGWIQQANLALTGLMLIVGAVGVRRAADRTPGGTWAPRLLGAYGLGLIGAGLFRADPAGGFPSGTPSGPASHISAQGSLHVLFGAAGFACLIAGCFVLARHYRHHGRRGAAATSRGVGVAFAVAFAGIATGSNNAAVVLAFCIAVIASSAWLTKVAIDLYRTTRVVDTAARQAPAA